MYLVGKSRIIYDDDPHFSSRITYTQLLPNVATLLVNARTALSPTTTLARLSQTRKLLPSSVPLKKLELMC